MTAPDTVVRTVDFLFLDRDRCTRCADTERHLRAAVESAAPILREQGIRVHVRQIHVATRDDAIRHQLISSPTVRIDGADIAPRLVESACDADSCRCADGTAVDCRLWEWQGELYEAAPVEALRAAILDPPALQESPQFVLPQHLAALFADRTDACCSTSELDVCCDSGERVTCCSDFDGGCGCR